MFAQTLRTLGLASSLALLAGLTACGGGGGDAGGGSTNSDTTLAFGYKVVGSDATYYVFHNADSKAVSFTADIDLSTAILLADGAKAGLTSVGTPTGVLVAGTKVTLDPLTSAIFKK